MSAVKCPSGLAGFEHNGDKNKRKRFTRDIVCDRPSGGSVAEEECALGW